MCLQNLEHSYHSRNDRDMSKWMVGPKWECLLIAINIGSAATQLEYIIV